MLAAYNSFVTFTSMKHWIIAAAFLSACLLRAADLQIDLDRMTVGEPPKGFVAANSGTGQPGEWKIILDDVPSAYEPLTALGKASTKRRVIAQTNTDATDERFPMLIYDDETFGDFQVSFRFKTVSGKVEQMAGFVFRVQDPDNFYVVRASSLGGTFRFYKVIKGKRTTPLGVELKIPSGMWHEMKVSSAANKIVAELDGQQMFAISDDTDVLPPGKIGFWTKSDSVSHFTDFKATYTPRIPLAQTLIEATLKQYSRIMGLRLYSTVAGKEGLYVIASDKKEDVGVKAIDGYKDILAGASYAYGHTKKTITVALPVRDRNGDIAAVVRIEMERFFGQTENNAIARALPVVKLMEQRIRSKNDLVQ